MEEPAVGVVQAIKSTVSKEREREREREREEAEEEEEEEERDTFTMPPVPNAPAIISNCVCPLMLMSGISDTSSNATESVEIDLD